MSSKGFGALSKVFNVLKREDLLKYGQAETKYMKIAKWEGKRRSIDFATLIPKL